MRVRAAPVLVLLLLAVPGAAASCKDPFPRFEDVEWTARGVYWIEGWELRRDDGATLARTFPAGTFHASPDGERVLFRRTAVDMATGGRERCGFEPYEDVAWTPGGTVDTWGTPLAIDWRGERAVTAVGRNVSVHELRDGAVVAGFVAGGQDAPADPHALDVGAAAWSPDGSKLALVTRSTVLLVDGTHYGPLYPSFPDYPARGERVAVAFTPDSRRLLVASSMGDRYSELRLLDLSGHEPRYEAARLDAREARGIAWSPDGSRLAVAYQHPRIHADDPSFAASLVLMDAHLVPLAETRWTGELAGRGVAWSPDGGRVALGVGERLVVLDPRNGSWGPDDLAATTPTFEDHGPPFGGPLRGPTRETPRESPAGLALAVAALALAALRRRA